MSSSDGESVQGNLRTINVQVTLIAVHINSNYAMQNIAEVCSLKLKQ